MFWFNKPGEVSEDVKAFLQFEKDWLLTDWNSNKLLLILTVPASLIALAFAFWKRNLPAGIAVVLIMALGKITWSHLSAGKSGQSILLPAIVGLIICIGLIYLGFKRLQKKQPR